MVRLIWGVLIVFLILAAVNVAAIPEVHLRANYTNNTFYFDGHPLPYFWDFFVNRSGDVMYGDLNISVGDTYVNMSAEDGGVHITGNFTAGIGLGSVNIIDGRLGFITDTPDYMIDMSSGSIGNLMSIESGTGVQQILYIYGRGGISFVADPHDVVPSARNFNWYEDGEALANKIMNLYGGSSHLTIGNGTSGELTVRGNASFYKGIEFVNVSATYGNVNLSGYYYGQPISGSIGSGVIWCDNVSTEGSVNVTCSGLTCYYPNMEVRLVDTAGTETYCDIAAGSRATTDDQHSVHYIDSNCDWQEATIANYLLTDLSPGG
ncbi:unnamed protein product, partial [marine sediment metagenome]